MMPAGPLQGYRAGVVSRVAAGGIDAAVVGAAAAAIYLAIAGALFIVDPRGFHFPEPHVILSVGSCCLLAVLYLGIGWSATGRTVGKQLAGLRIVAGSGARVRPAVALARSLTCVVFPAGLLWCAISSTNSSLHDVLFHTVVVYDWSGKIPPSEGE